MYCHERGNAAVAKVCVCVCVFITSYSFWVYDNHIIFIRKILSCKMKKKYIYIYITGFFKDGNQYKELHEDTVISFPF